MNLKQAKVGMKVKIVGIDATHDKFRSDRTMRRMVNDGQTYTIDSVNFDNIYIAGYMWSACDVNLVSEVKTIVVPKVKKSETFIFDENLL